MANGGTLIEYNQYPEAATGEDDITWTFGGVNEDGSFYFINTKTGECVQNLPPTATTSAASPEAPSAFFIEHAAIYDSYEPAVVDCVVDLVTSIEDHLKDWTRRRQRNAKSIAKRARKQAAKSTRALKPNNQTAMREENEQTTRANDDSRLAQRILHRQLTQKKQSDARQRANFKHEENHVRLHLTRVLLAQATNGLDVHGKIDFVAPPEHELQVRFQERQQLAALFSELVDNSAASLSSLEALYALSTKLELQKAVEARRGLLKLTTDGILQAFFLHLPQPLTVVRFVRFVEICEDVMDQVDRIKLAMESAKLGVVSADLVEWHQSMASVKTGLSSFRQLAAVNRLEQSLTTALDTCRSQLRPILHFHMASKSSKSQDNARHATIPHQPIWQLNHKHVYIQMDGREPLYCVHCRQARLRLEKLDRLELEAHHRAHWGRALAHALHEKEAAILQWHRGTQNVPAMPTMSVNATVGGILNNLVAAVAFLESFATWQSLLFAENPMKASATAETLHVLTTARDDLERCEFERACVFDVDEFSADVAEAATMAMERPLVREQEAAHTELARLVHACLEPSMYIRRLQFQQLLAIRSPTDNMVLRVLESGETHDTCILTTMRCATLDQAAAIVAFAKQLETRALPHVVGVNHAFAYTYQHFSTGGNLNECWPIVFVVTKDCERAFHMPLKPLAPAEVLDVIRTVSAALSALHSQGFVHLNVNPGNLYRAKDTGELQLGGFLAFKHPYTPAELNQSHSTIALLLSPTVLPPELAQGSSTAAAINDKTDMWALGCLLYSLLTGATHDILKDKPLSAIMKDIPLRYGPSLRSCLRMLLQPLPRHRPTATEIFNFLSCVSPDEKDAAPLAAPPPPKTTKKKSLPSLPTRSSSGSK